MINADIDGELSRMLKRHTDIRQFTVKLDEAIQTTCRKTCKHLNPPNPKAKGKSIPWWTDVLTIMRKRTNALRRRYQRTTSDEALRESRKKQYTKAKTQYQAAIKKEKIESWKQYCTVTSPNNPWNEVYKLATSKTRNNVTLTTPHKPDGSKTANMTETLRLMLDHLILNDNTQDNTDYHKTVRRLAEQPMHTMDDKEFTQDKVRQVIEGFKPKKEPGPNGITNEIIKLVFKAIPKTMTSIYNECLRTGCFPENWKIAEILPIAKPGREDSQDPSKYRPISLLNTEGKVLELLIKRVITQKTKRSLTVTLV